MHRGPVIDGELMGTPVEPYIVIAKGGGKKVNLMLGSNLDEGAMLVYGLYMIINNITNWQNFPKLSDEALITVLNHFFSPNTTSEALLYYPKSDYSDNTHRAGDIVRDYFFLCEARRSARAMV